MVAKQTPTTVDDVFATYLAAPTTYNPVARIYTQDGRPSLAGEIDLAALDPTQSIEAALRNVVGVAGSWKLQLHSLEGNKIATHGIFHTRGAPAITDDAVHLPGYSYGVQDHSLQAASLVRLQTLLETSERRVRDLESERAVAHARLAYAEERARELQGQADPSRLFRAVDAARDEGIALGRKLQKMESDAERGSGGFDLSSLSSILQTLKPTTQQAEPAATLTGKLEALILQSIAMRTEPASLMQTLTASGLATADEVLAYVQQHLDEIVALPRIKALSGDDRRHFLKLLVYLGEGREASDLELDEALR